MKIAIISDTHDNLPNLEKTLAYLKRENIQTVIHCGDICSRAFLRILAKNFTGKIYWVMGNVHADEEEMTGTVKEFNNLFYFEDFGEAELDGLKIGFIHFPNEAKVMAESEKYDYVFYGHTHKPWEEKIGKTVLANPGTLAGMFYKASFAVLDTSAKKLDLKILELL